MTTAAVDHPSSDQDEDGGKRTIGGSRAFALLLVITGAAGLLAAWVITIDKFKLLEDPNFTPGCSLNPVVACGNIMKSEQASAFGFPNPMLGLVTYSVIIGIGLALLAGARFRSWYWLGMNAGDAVRRRLLHLAPVPVALQHQLALPVVLPGLGRHDLHVLLRHHAQHQAPDPARAELAAQRTDGVPLGAAGAVDRHHRHADPDPLVGLLDQLTGPPLLPGDRPGRDVSAVT